MHTIKPFDNDLFLDCLSKVKAVISVEEHSENGGLGEKCASIISQSNINIPFKIIGFINIFSPFMIFSIPSYSFF